MVADPIADFITRLKNAAAVGGVSVSVPFSKLTLELALILKREGFLADVLKRGRKLKRSLEVTLAYDDAKQPEVRGAERVSRLSRRVYLKSDEIKPVRFGHGLLVLSTSKGLKTDREARKEGIGGEALFKIW